MQHLKFYRGSRLFYDSAKLDPADCVEVKVLSPENFDGVFTSLKYANTKTLLAQDNGVMLSEYDIIVATHYGATTKNVMPKVTMVVDVPPLEVTAHYQCVIFRGSRLHQAALLAYLISEAGMKGISSCIEGNILKLGKWRSVLKEATLYRIDDPWFDKAVKYASTAAVMKHDAERLVRTHYYASKAMKQEVM